MCIQTGFKPSHHTLFLETLEEALSCRHKAPEAEATSQVGAQQAEGLEIRGVMKVVAMLFQPEADHGRQRTVRRRRRDADMLTTVLHRFDFDELRVTTALDVKHSPARADGVIQAGC